MIHFTGTDDDSVLDWSKCEVICTDLAQFLRGGIVEVKIYRDDELNDLYPVEHIVDYARACLGDKGYNLAFNNCEHFANVCTLGRFRSRQVERVLSGKLPLEEDKGMENDRIELMKQARLDILQYETESQIALEQAKAQGLAAMAQTIITMQDKLNEVAEKRLLIIEKGSLQVIKDIESFYDELGTKIQEDDDRYNTEKLPELLSILEKYETGTPAHSLYMKRIEEDMEMQSKHVTQQLDSLSQRQTQIIDGFLASKERIIEQTGQITVSSSQRLGHLKRSWNEKEMVYSMLNSSICGCNFFHMGIQRTYKFTFATRNGTTIKSEQIQPLFRTVRVSGDCDTAVFFADKNHKGNQWSQ